jgi:hypothetical protein
MEKAKGALALFLSIGLATPALAHPHVMDLLTEQATNGIAFASKYQNQPVVLDDYVIASTASPSGVGSISVGKPDRFGLPPHAARCAFSWTINPSRPSVASTRRPYHFNG